jgi:hypothetical protein
VFEAEHEAAPAVFVELAGQMDVRVTGPEAAELMVFAAAAVLTTSTLQVSPTTVSFNQTLVT